PPRRDCTRVLGPRTTPPPPDRRSRVPAPHALRRVSRADDRSRLGPEPPPRLLAGHGRRGLLEQRRLDRAPRRHRPLDDGVLAFGVLRGLPLVHRRDRAAWPR